MATRDIWKPGYEFARTPNGHETMIPQGLSPEQRAAFLAEADAARDSDPAHQERDKRNSKRREQFERQMAPARAYREQYRRRFVDGAEELPADFDREADYKAFVDNFKRERRAREARAGKLPPDDVNEARRKLGLEPDDLSW
jgi:hypothetical protein